MTTISSGQTVTLTDGQSDTGTEILSGGFQYVESGALAAYAIAYGIQNVYGGVTSDTFVEAGGAESVFSGASSAAVGSAVQTYVLSDGDLYVFAAGLALSATIYAGGEEDIYQLGVDSSADVRGVQNVWIGGSAVAATIGAGAYQYLHGYADGLSAVVDSGGAQIVHANGAAWQTDVRSGGYLEVQSGGSAGARYVGDPGTVVEGGGVMSLDPGGLVYLTSVGAGAEAYFSGLSESAQVHGAEHLYSGATESYATVGFGGDIYISSGAVASSVTVSSGGAIEVLDQGSGFYASVLPGGREDVYGESILSIIGDGTGGGDQYVYAGSANTTHIDGGTQHISGGVAYFDTVSSGAVLVESGGAASGTTVLLGDQIVDLGGTASGTLISGAGARQTVNSGGAASATTVRSGGVQTINPGGHARGTSVSSGGVELLSRLGLEVAGTVMSGGTLVLAGAVVSPGAALSARIEGATTVVSGVSLLSGAALDLVGTRVLSGGVDVVVASGVASATVLSRGAEWVASGGLAVGATVSSGGTQTVFTGGLASGTVVSSQGSLIVSAGGVARNAAVLSGGALIDNGKLLVSDGRTLAGSLSGSGWIAETGHNTLVLADSGAGFAGRAIISHGVIELATATAIGSGAVVFAAPPAVEAVLRVDAADSPIAGGTFANLLSNFDGGGEGLDLRGVAFHTGAKAVVSGAVLTLSEGGKTYNFKLGGGMAASYQVTNDGGGGTLINPLAAALAHRMAAFRAVDAASPTLGVEGAPVTAGCLGLAPLQDGRNGAANPG